MDRITIEVEGTPERIWQALTSQESYRDWFNTSMEIEPREGGRVAFEGTIGDQPFRYEGTVALLKPREQLRFDLRDLDGESATIAFSLTPGTDFTLVEFAYEGFDVLDAEDDEPFWSGDELIVLRDWVTGIGPTH